MNFQNITNKELSFRFEKLVRTERKITHLVLLHINEFESRRLYADLGYDSMFSYMTKGLGYSESSSYRRLQSARLLKQVPSVVEKLESGALNLSQLTTLQKCLKDEKQQGNSISTKTTEIILNQLENKNTFETSKILATAFNRPVVKCELVKPQADESVRLELTFTKDEFAELERAKSLISHVSHTGEWKEVILALARKTNKAKLGSLEKKSLMVKSKRTTKLETLKTKAESLKLKTALKDSDLPKVTHSFARADCSLEQPKITSIKNESLQHRTVQIEAKQAGKGQSKIKQSSSKTKRAYLPVSLKRNLLKQAKLQCQYKTNKGSVCGSNYQLQFDHIIPKALGGGDHPENFQVLCRTHNLLLARKWGISKTK